MEVVVSLCRHFLDWRFLRFLIVGVINTLTGLGVIYSLKWFLDYGDVSANVIGYAVGLTVSFALNSTWSFRYEGPRLRAAARFFVVFLVAYAANLSVVMTLIEVFGINSYLAQAIGVPPYTILFYLGSRLFAFRAADLASEQGPDNLAPEVGEDKK